MWQYSVLLLQVELITGFATKVYFQHYELFQFGFTHEQGPAAAHLLRRRCAHCADSRSSLCAALDQHTTEVFVQTAMGPPPLMSYVTSSMDEVVEVAKPDEKARVLHAL